MAYRVLELTLVSAVDLKKVTRLSRMRVYAVASISGGDPRIPTHCTNADRTGGCSPTWNVVFHYPIPAAADTRGLALHVLLRAERAVFGDRDVGEVFVPLDELLAGTDVGETRSVSYQVRRPHTGRAQGVIYFCYKFADVPAAGIKQGHQHANKEVRDTEKAACEAAMAAPPVVTAYPPQPHAMPAPARYPPVTYGSRYPGYPPQPYGSAAPSPYGYNVAAPQYGYEAPPPMAVPGRKQGGGMGMGLGLGLLGGAVGGMMVGDMMGDMEADAAYDAGFNDGLEF
ncbi:hypothetical protein ACP4OV_010442 [Aristida adscensionis]